jgi:hypothetical protein
MIRHKGKNQMQKPALKFSQLEWSEPKQRYQVLAFPERENGTILCHPGSTMGATQLLKVSHMVIGGCETWVPLGPHRPGSRPSPTSGFGLLRDLPTCQWAQPT